MSLLHLLRREINEPLRPLIIFLLLSGLSSALLLGLINAGAENSANQVVNHRLFLLYLLCILLFLFTKRYVLDRSSIIVESVMAQVRVRVADKLRHADLSTFEIMGTSTIYARISQDVNLISNFSTSLINAIQSALMILFSLLYIASISLFSFLLIGGGISLGIVIYMRYSKAFVKMWDTVTIKETEFFEKLSHILKGFKEIKMNRSKNEAVFNNYVIFNNENRDLRTKVGKFYNIIIIFSQVFFYFLLGFVIFILPDFHAEYTEDVIKVTAAILFIIGPFETLVSANPMVATATSAAQNIIALEEQLEEALSKNEDGFKVLNSPEAYEAINYEHNIRLQDLAFAYPPAAGQKHIFQVGPVNLTFGKGELIFITGGNGSGKSTFLKLLTGLYRPSSGGIFIDQDNHQGGAIAVTESNYQQYRNLFTTIFTDFHLFDKLYGLRDIQPEIVKKLLRNMELPEDKTTYKDGGFTNLNLSSGQRKRLALAATLLEDKPIYIFDEVAADLDPEFRDKYYYKILKELKERNKTVIVVSHDRHYWTVPDRLLEMQDGNLRELSKAEIDEILAMNR